jgi:Ca2+-binding RTX toxin-like protein
MAKIVRALIALALVTVLAGARADAAPRPEGDVFQANITFDVVVRGTPPPGATITVDTPNNELAQQDIALADTGGPNDGVEVVSGTIYRDVFLSDDAGATAVQFACTMTQNMPTVPMSSCAGATADEHHAQPHADIFFQLGTGRFAHVTITLTFGGCYGRPGTVFLGKADTPTAGPDVIIGTAANNQINGLGGDDVICGRGGNDTLRGGDGRDRLYGENGNDRLEGGLRGDRLIAGAGTDTLLGLAGNDALDGGAQRDTCNGGTEHDSGVRCEVRNGIP